MPRDSAPLTSALDDARPGEPRDVYSVLAAWDQSIHPDRLRRLDDSCPFDLARAADEYGPVTDP